MSVDIAAISRLPAISFLGDRTKSFTSLSIRGTQFPSPAQSGPSRFYILLPRQALFPCSLTNLAGRSAISNCFSDTREKKVKNMVSYLENVACRLKTNISSKNPAGSLAIIAVSASINQKV